MLKSQSRYFGYPFKCANNQLRNVQLPVQSSQRWRQQIGTTNWHKLAIIEAEFRKQIVNTRLNSYLVRKEYWEKVTWRETEK